jgi:ribulose-5-phosphate 4-epimerase/fuculose-1-phosphate aldolase
MSADPVRQARVDLAAAHRLAVMHGFNEGICNHFTLNVPGRPGAFLAIPYGLHWAEVRARDFLVVGYDGAVLEGDGEVELTAWCIHAPIHRLAPNATAVLHTHMPYATAITLLEDQRLHPLGQISAIMYHQVCYDDDYTGLAFAPSEGERLAGKLEPGKSILMMANHGVMVCGSSVADAYDRLYYLERACQTQVLAYQTGRPLKGVKPEIVAKLGEQWSDAAAGGHIVRNGPTPAEMHFSALKRLLDRSQPDYAQ